MMNTTKSSQIPTTDPTANSQSDTSLHNKHAFDLDAEVEPVPEIDIGMDIGGGPAGDAGEDHFDDFAGCDDDDAGILIGSIDFIFWTISY